MGVYRQQWHTNTMYVITCAGGSVQLTLWNDGESKYPTYISHLWVDEPERRKGYATMLLAKAEEIAKAEGRNCAYLEWDERDTPIEILRWYERNGYKEVALGQTCSLMRKELK